MFHVYIHNRNRNRNRNRNAISIQTAGAQRQGKANLSERGGYKYSTPKKKKAAHLSSAIRRRENEKKKKGVAPSHARQEKPSLMPLSFANAMLDNMFTEKERKSLSSGARHTFPQPNPASPQTHQHIVSKSAGPNVSANTMLP